MLRRTAAPVELRRGPALAAIVVAAGFWGAPTRAAESSPASVTVSFAAPASCPPRAEFLARILARTSRAELLPVADEHATVRIEIQPVARGFEGRLHLRGDGEEASERIVDAATCLEVVDALALVTALMLDPAAMTAPLGPGTLASPEAAPPDAPVPPPSADDTPAPDAKPAVPPQPTSTRPPTPPPPPKGPRERRKARPRPTPPPRRVPGAPRFDTGIGIELASATAPSPTEPMPTLRLFAGFVGAGRPAHPYLGASLAAGRVDTAREDTNATFTWLAVRGDLCAGAPLRTTWLALRPCVAADAGALSGSARSSAAQPLVDARVGAVPWASVAALLRADLTPTRIALLRLEAGPVVPIFSAASFYLDGGSRDRVLLDVPAIGYVAGAGAGIRW